MKVKLVETEEDWDVSHEVLVDGKSIASISSLSECPEDAIIGRDLLDGNDVVGYIEMGYEAGKRGEELIIE